MTPWPGASTTANDKTLKVLSTRVAAETGEVAPIGTIVTANKDGVVVACGAGSVRILSAQLEGRKPLAAGELVSGRAVSAGMRLGRREAP